MEGKLRCLKSGIDKMKHNISHIRTRGLALLLVISVLLTMIPQNVFAKGVDTSKHYTEKHYEVGTCIVDYKINATKQNKTNISITITNNGPYDITNWKIKFPFKSKIIDIWDGEYSLKDENCVIQGDSYNDSISKNETIEFGMIVDSIKGVPYAPKNMDLVCNVKISNNVRQPQVQNKITKTFLEKQIYSTPENNSILPENRKNQKISSRKKEKNIAIQNKSQNVNNYSSKNILMKLMDKIKHTNKKKGKNASSQLKEVQVLNIKKVSEEETVVTGEPSQSPIFTIVTSPVTVVETTKPTPKVVEATVTPVQSGIQESSQSPALNQGTTAQTSSPTPMITATVTFVPTATPAVTTTIEPTPTPVADMIITKATSLISDTECGNLIVMGGSLNLNGHKLIVDKDMKQFGGNFSASSGFLSVLGNMEV